MRGRVRCGTRFPPQDFGFDHTMPIAPEPRTPEQPRARRRSSRSDVEPATDIIPAPFDDVEVEEEDMEPLETSLESLDEGQDDEEEDDDFFKLDDPVEDADEDDEDNILDNEEDDEDE